MAKNYIQEGNVISFVAPSGGVTSGQGVLIGTRLAVAAHDAPAATACEGFVEGVFELPKAAGVVAQGAALYWDTTPGELTTTASGNTLVGYAFRAAADAATTVQLKLAG